MEPAFQRGDLLFLWNRNLGMNQYAGPPANTPGTQVGEVVVYNVVGKDIPIVHRVVRRHKGKCVPTTTTPPPPPSVCSPAERRKADGSAGLLP